MAGGWLATVGCDGAGTDRWLSPLGPSRELELMPSGEDDSDALEALLRTAVDHSTSHVVVRHAGGRPYRITRPIQVPEGVRLEGERVAGERPQIHTVHGGQIALGSHCTMEGLHLVGPGASSVDRQEDAVPGINSGGQVDFADGTVRRWTEGWTLRDCKVEQFSGAGINTGMAVRNVRVEAVESVDNGNAGIQVGLLSEAVQISGGQYLRNGTNGIDVNGTRCLIEDTEVAWNGWNRFWDAEHARASDRNGILVYIAPFRGTAETARLEALQNVIRNNRCLDNERAGIMAVGTSAGTPVGAVQREVLIEGNFATRNLAGIMIEGAGTGELRHAMIRRNLLISNGNRLEGEPKGWGFLALGTRYPFTRLEENVFGGNWTAPWLFAGDKVIRSRNVVYQRGVRHPPPSVPEPTNPKPSR